MSDVFEFRNNWKVLQYRKEYWKIQKISVCSTPKQSSVDDETPLTDIIGIIHEGFTFEFWDGLEDEIYGFVIPANQIISDFMEIRGGGGAITYKSQS